MSPVTLVCAPSVRTDAQQSLYHTWCELLGSKGFHVEALRRADYATDPWEQLAGLMNVVDGVVVLGLRQMEIRDGLWRDETPEMATVSAVWTSPWMQVEAGMAIASGKPVLAVPECGVSEGIFAPQNWTSNVFGAPAENPSSIGVQRWAAIVRNRHLSRSLVPAP
jgi:hypothetical protein